MSDPSQTGVAELSFRNEASLSLAQKTLNGRTLFGRKLIASLPVVSELPLPPVPFSFPPPTPPFFQFPPYNDQIGAHILRYASIRSDFYHSILMLMKSLGLPPPFVGANQEGVLNTAPPNLASQDQDVAPGARIKRDGPDPVAASSSGSLDMSNELNGLPPTKKRLESDLTSTEETELDTEPMVPPPQPQHIDWKVTRSSDSSYKSSMSIVLEANKRRSPNEGLSSPNLEIVPFPSHVSCSVVSARNSPKTFISEDELNGNRMTRERTLVVDASAEKFHF